MAGGPTLPGPPAHRHRVSVDAVELRELVPRVLSVLVRRGADFATAEDAVQEALVRAFSAWGDELPADPTGWLITVAWRAFLDMTRSDTSRRNREVRFDTEPPAGAIPSADDTLRLYFLCAHPALTSSSAVALTLRAVGGLTTRQIPPAYLAPEPPMARNQLGEYQAQAAIAALHADAPRVEETDWVQIVEWYDELLRFADTPIVRLNRAVAVGEADGAPAGLAALAEVDGAVPRREAVAAYLHEKKGDLELAARLYADAARNAPNLAERDHQTRQAARLNHHVQHQR